MRRFGFDNYTFYHIFNRGVDKRKIYLGYYDYGRFIRSMREFNRIEPVGSLYEEDYRRKSRFKGVKHPIGCLTPLIEFISYCLVVNHYHFLVR